MKFDELILFLEADSWISGFIFPDLTIIFSKSNWEHHGDLIYKHEKLFQHYFENEYSIEEIEENFSNGNIHIFKNRNIVPFVIQAKDYIIYDTQPTEEQEKALKSKVKKIISNFGEKQGVYL